MAMKRPLLVLNSKTIGELNVRRKENRTFSPKWILIRKMKPSTPISVESRDALYSR